MNYWSDSNGFFYDNTINTPLYHLMTMFCKIMQRECFFSFRKACPWICYSLGGECYSLWHHTTSGPPGVNRLHQSPRVITPVSDSFSDLLPFTCPETEMTEDELNVLRYFIFCVENQSAIEEIIVVNPILICWYFSIWNC